MTKAKKEQVYKVLWLLTGFWLGILVGGVIELIYLNNGGVVSWSLGVAYLVAVILGLWLGRWAGPKAWKKIYVDGVRGPKYLG